MFILLSSSTKIKLAHLVVRISMVLSMVLYVRMLALYDILTVWASIGDPTSIGSRRLFDTWRLLEVLRYVSTRRLGDMDNAR